MTSTDPAPSLTYQDYLRIDDLLNLAQPVSSPADSRVHAAELFFITAHQTAELWVRQVLVDVREAVLLLSATPQDVEQAAQHLLRAADILRLLRDNLNLLRRLPPVDFAQFRRLLGRASGAESVQFRELGQALGTQGAPSPLSEAVERLLADQATTSTDVYHNAPRNGPLDGLLEAMAELSQNYWQWQVMHVHIVLRAIGIKPGTGGTSGADYLMSRITIPFPELWAARAGVHSETGKDQR